jgi:hypothetical protein
MPQAAFANNPFMLMLQPEVVFDMMEKSEALAQLNRHTCRPLDRISPQAPGAETEDTEAAPASDVGVGQPS